ncbi:phage tail tube protein [Stenotrophomonas sp. PS02298]|uniref:phage tail tube protein n=1 Tax=Stenotrophomonas sp. PS02298 TaxID=2991424 RepID=UPI00249AF6B7|nr:phage tail tube protein [Stenotrophomonas sp. PS02298]
MANPLKRLGKAKIKIGSMLLETMPGATLDVGGVARATQVGANAVLGFSETPKQSRVECSVSLRKGVSVQELHTEDATVTFEGDTGQVWSIRNAWSVETPVVNSGDGTARCVYEGLPAEEVV